MARRGENIFKRKDGRWEARVIECRSDGKRVYRSLYGKTYTEAKAKKEEYYGINRFESAPSAKKLAAFSWLAGEWLASVRGTVKESTYIHGTKILPYDRFCNTRSRQNLHRGVQ